MRALFVLAVLLAGCGGSSGPCAQRAGTYRQVASERSGTCGALPESIDTIDGQPLAPEPPCTGQIRYSADNCEVTLVDVTCPEDGIGPGVTSTLNGKATWSEDASRGTAIATIVVREASGVALCSSSYDLAYERI